MSVTQPILRCTPYPRTPYSCPKLTDSLSEDVHELLEGVFDVEGQGHIREGMAEEQEN
jgi:hypothetical protein